MIRHHISTRAASLVAAWVLVLLVPSSAVAQPAQPPAPVQQPAASDLAEQAAARKKAGDEAMEALRYADALAAYGDAHAITKDPALLYNMGRALQALNRFPEALEKLQAFEAAASPELKARVPRLPKLIAEIRERVSTLTVRTNVNGAKVVVRNTIVGRSPLAGPVKLTAGPAEVEVEADGYFPAKKSVDLVGGGEVSVSLELYSRDTTGVLSVKTSAPGAQVFVDGRSIGIAPVESNVPKGTHQVAVKHPDFRVYETSVVVPAGGSKSLSVSLQSKSVVTRWWFWTGVGVLVAAGVGISIVAVTERPPDSGTIAPGQLKTRSFQVGARATVVEF